MGKATISRNASMKAMAWEQRFTEQKDEVEKQRPPPTRNMTLDVDADHDAGLESLSKSELAQLANEFESEQDEPVEEVAKDELAQGELAQDELAQNELAQDELALDDDDDDALVAVTAHVTQTAIESAMDDLKEQSLLESAGSESFDKSEQIHSGIITSSTSTYESVSLEQQSEELPTDAQTEETSEANTEDPVFEAELNTPAELKTPDDLKTPDFAKDNYNIAPVTRGDELLEPCEPCNENELKSEHAFKSRNESGNNNTSLTKIKSLRTRAQRALSQPIFSQASLAIIEKARVESDMKENISEEIITGKTSLTDRVAFWTRRSSFLTEKKDDENKAAKTEEIVGAFRRQGSVRDMASKFGKFERNSQTRKSWCAPSASLKLQQQQALQQEEQEQPSPKIRSRTVGSKMSVSSNEENQKPVPKVRKHSIDARAEETKPAAVPVPKMRSSLILDQQQKVRIRKK